MRLGSRLIGPGQPCFIIAEAGVNHDGDLDCARQLVAAAAAAGADAIKFQTFDAARLVVDDAPKAAYQQRQTGGGSQAEMLRALQLDQAAFALLAADSTARGLVFASTPFDCESADLLNQLDMPFFKIGSGDLTNVPLLRHVAGLGRPMVVSTGMATVEEVDHAVDVVRRAGVTELALLHCVSQYPAPAADTNLAALATLQGRYGVPVGLSDHSLGSEISLAAVALGAPIIEKHLTLDRSRTGPDHAASLGPGEFADMVRQIRNIEAALGDGVKRPRPSELELRVVARRSLYAVDTIPAGRVVTAAMIQPLRPDVAISAADVDQVVGRRTRCEVASGAPLRWEDLI